MGFWLKVSQERRNHGTFQAFASPQRSTRIGRTVGGRASADALRRRGRLSRKQIQDPRGSRELQQQLSPWLR